MPKKWPSQRAELKKLHSLSTLPRTGRDVIIGCLLDFFPQISYSLLQMKCPKNGPQCAELKRLQSLSALPRTGGDIVIGYVC